MTKDFPWSEMNRGFTTPSNGDRLEGWERSPSVAFCALLAVTVIVVVPFALLIALYDALMARLVGHPRHVEQPLSWDAGAYFGSAVPTARGEDKAIRS